MIKFYFINHHRNQLNPEARRTPNLKAVKIQTTVERGTSGSDKPLLHHYIYPPLHKADQTLAFLHPYLMWQLCLLTLTSLECPGYLVAAVVVVMTVAQRNIPLPRTASGAIQKPPPLRCPRGAISD